MIQSVRVNTVNYLTYKPFIKEKNYFIAHLSNDMKRMFGIERPVRNLTAQELYYGSKNACGTQIGGIIGKSSSVNKQLRQATRAKIRMEEAQVKSPDRVVVVVAPSAIRSKIWLRTTGLENVNGGGEEEIEVAPFGSVIGKGGKVVEKIRKETDCKIRVLNEKLPACAVSTDEMVEVVIDWAGRYLHQMERPLDVLFKQTLRLERPKDRGCAKMLPLKFQRLLGKA
ncbi:hypothetical protein ACE6H2_011280 [Prunus campanulata]